VRNVGLNARADTPTARRDELNRAVNAGKSRACSRIPTGSNGVAPATLERRPERVGGAQAFDVNPRPYAASYTRKLRSSTSISRSSPSLSSIRLRDHGASALLLPGPTQRCVWRRPAPRFAQPSSPPDAPSVNTVNTGIHARERYARFRMDKPISGDRGLRGGALSATASTGHRSTWRARSSSARCPLAHCSSCATGPSCTPTS